MRRLRREIARELGAGGFEQQRIGRAAGRRVGPMGERVDQGRECPLLLSISAKAASSVSTERSRARDMKSAVVQ